MTFSKLFGIFTYSEDLTGFKEKALMSSGLRKSLIGLAILGCCSGGTIAAACNNSRVNTEVAEAVDKPQKNPSEIISKICAENLEQGKLKDPKLKSTCTNYIKTHPTTEGTKPIVEVIVA